MVASHGVNEAPFNNAGQHFNHLHFWKWMGPGGGGTSLPSKLSKKFDEDLDSQTH